jgi:hypothetical protein
MTLTASHVSCNRQPRRAARRKPAAPVNAILPVILFSHRARRSATRIDSASGNLTHVSTVSAGPDSAHLSTDRAGRYLLTAYYFDALSANFAFLDGVESRSS